MKIALTGALLASALVLPLAVTAGDFSPYVDSQGGISRPTDFRTNFVHLGSYAVLDEKSASRGLHDVYTEKASAEHYRKTGKFLDGATLVKGVLSQNRRNFRHPSSSPATSASRSIILPSLWKV